MLTPEELSEKILDYLLRNPDAGDTLEGVSAWWLEMEKVDQAVDRVGNALNLLLERGVIEKVPSGKSTSLYRISRSVKSQLISGASV